MMPEISQRAQEVGIGTNISDISTRLKNRELADIDYDICRCQDPSEASCGAYLANVGAIDAQFLMDFGVTADQFASGQERYDTGTGQIEAP
jgi:hypothetical protein